MGLIMISSIIIPPPAGADLTTLEGLTAAMANLGPEHFIFPFLAHASGTFVAAYITARFSRGRRKTLALLCGLLYFIGGLINVIWLPAPLWFEAIDLLGAYLPMAWLGAKLAVPGRPV